MNTDRKSVVLQCLQHHEVHIMDVLVIRQKVILDAMLCLNFAESEQLTNYYISELECYANRLFDDEFISNIDE